MKHTLKFKNALLVASAVITDRAALQAARRNNAAMYDALERLGWFWDAQAGAWQDFKKSTSMFTTDDGLPTGSFRLRLMAHPGDMQRLIEVITEALDTYGARVLEVSNLYPNRRGPGQRVYMSCQLPAASEKPE